MGIQTRPSTGSRGVIHVGEETNYGVLVSPTHLIEFTSETLSADENTLQSEAIREDRGRHQLIRGNFDVQGEISFEQNVSGLGMLLRHALGDYVICPKSDGGAHGRLAKAAALEIPVPTGVVGGNRFALVFTDDHSGGFEAETGRYAVVRRDATNTLVYDDNAAAGYAYDNYTNSAVTYVTAVTPDDNTHSGTGLATALTLAQVRDADGVMVNPDFNPMGGVVKIGPQRKEYRYFQYIKASRTLYLCVAGPGGTGTLGDPLVNDYVQGLAGLIKTNAANFVHAAALDVGQWIFQYDVAYEQVFTHLIERGRYLPVGLTIEVGRDAAYFLYSGCKADTLSLSFEANAIVTGSLSFVARAEHSVTRLEQDVIPGATSILIKNGDAFPQPEPGETAMFTIGEETELRYETKTVNPDGTCTLSGISANLADVHSIHRFHPRGSNVDSRSSTRALATIEGDNTPLSAFEIMVYIDGYFEEVMSGSITLNNNLNTDKFGLGSRFRLATIEGRAEVEGSLMMEFDDGKHYKKYVEGEFFSVEFKCVSEADDSEINNTGVASQAYYILPKCKFDGTTPQISSDDIINMDMPITAVVDNVNKTTDLVIILVNDNQWDVEAA